MQLLHELVLLLETIDKRLVLPTCKINLLTCHIKEYFNPKPYPGYQFEIKIEDSKSKIELPIFFILSSLSNSNKHCQKTYKA